MALLWPSYLLDVGHAAVDELYGVPVENVPQFVARWKRSFNEADERTSGLPFFFGNSVYVYFRGDLQYSPSISLTLHKNLNLVSS